MQNAILQRVNELSVKELNAANSQSGQTANAVGVEELNKQLLGLANTKNANGEYLFSLFKSATKAFNKNMAGGGYAYAGDVNQRTIQIGEIRQIADGYHGSNVFGIPAGLLPATVPSPGSITDIFKAIDTFPTDMRRNAPNSGIA